MQKQNSRKLLSAAAALAAAALLGGCQLKSWVDPGELGRGEAKKGDQLTVKIIDQLDPGTAELDPRFPRAEDPKPEDLVATTTDYRIGPGDAVDIAVTDLTQQGVETVNTRQVTESGNINLPLLKQPVRADGLTETDLAQAITQAYKNENIIQEAQVTVTLRVKRNRTYSILGAIETPGEYEITTNDFRLLNALTQARDISRGFANGVDFLFIVRKVESDVAAGTAPAGTTAPTAPTAPGPSAPAAPPAAPRRDPLAPQSRATHGAGGASGASAIPLSYNSKRVALMQNNPEPVTATPAAAQGTPTAANTAATVPSTTAGETEGRFIIVDGKPVQVGGQAQQQQQQQPPQAAPAPAPRPSGAPATGGFAFNAPKAEGDTRTIRISMDALRNGDLSHNIVIRPKDIIIIPTPRNQVYYVGGHVAAPGAYNMIPGNKITLMDAVIAARMLDGIAIPARTDVVRRIGNEKMYVRVDLEKIFAGQQPDIYLKENDNVMVGTNGAAPFISAFRNAFRITYGLGFLYDRNFAYSNNRNSNF
jgi:protein involved in polysaccharide export with SLBB domain